MDNNRLYTAEEVAAIIGLSLQSTRKLLSEDGIYRLRTKKKDETGKAIFEEKQGIKARKVGRSYLVTSDAIREYLGGNFDEPSTEAETIVQVKKHRQILLPEAKKKALEEAKQLEITDPGEIEKLTEKHVAEMIQAEMDKRNSKGSVRLADTLDGVMIPDSLMDDLTKALNSIIHKNRPMSKENMARASRVMEYLKGQKS